MILVRDVFQCKYGKAGELVALMRDNRTIIPPGVLGRILTDASGPFDTVVSEWTLESMGAWEEFLRTEFSHPDFGQWFARMQELVESGRREFYTIEIETA